MGPEGSSAHSLTPRKQTFSVMAALPSIRRAPRAPESSLERMLDKAVHLEDPSNSE